MKIVNPLMLNKRSNKKIKIFCVGDIMLDQNSFNKTNRISPEGPFPILRKMNHLYNLGGAGNVFNNLRSYTDDCYIYALIGTDDNGKIIKELLPKNNKKTNLYTELDRITTHKNRLFSGPNQILRIDNEEKKIINSITKTKILKSLQKNSNKSDILIISDYDKGMLDDDFTKKLITLASKKGLKVIVDPKSYSFAKYENAFLVKPNYKEFCLMCNKEKISDHEIVSAAREQLKKYNIGNILVTKGSSGMTLITAKKSYEYHSSAKEVFDVSGAGDTVISTLAFFLSLNYPIEDATDVANIAAGIVVGKIGACSINLFELLKVYEEDKENIYHEDDISKLDMNSILNTEKIIGFTNGCFDLIHSGHIKLLKEARKKCDFLILGLNSDSSVKLNKGKNRPINNEVDRAKVLKAIKYVDMVVIFDKKTPLSLIKKIRPNIMFKGDDYLIDDIAGSKYVKSYGGKISLIPLLKNKSSTKIISKIQ